MVVNQVSMFSTLMTLTCRNITLSALGFLQACLNKSSDANLLRLHNKSARGPISSNSIRGILVSDFFKSILEFICKIIAV